MKNFQYFRPTTVEQAVGLLGGSWGGAELLAGGTDLLDLQKEYVAQPDKVISLSGIPTLAGIKVSAGSVTIGAATKLADIAAHPDLRRHFPALTTAAGDVGGPQIRNMGTLGGNLCQRNRCWYFRDEGVKCLLKGGDKCFALDGDNRYHAIFPQGSPCVIVSPSTLAPALMVLNATVDIQGPVGKETIPVANFFHAPGEPYEREHVLAPNQVVTAVTIPIAGLKNASYEVRHKQAYDWPLVQAAAAFKFDGGQASNATIVLGHVSPKPIISLSAARELDGKAVTEASASAAGKATAKGAKPLSKNGYKIKLLEVAVKRAVLAAAGNRYWEV
jgi:xanthine dehydrogenase YagS FAD-binding subunit